MQLYEQFINEFLLKYDLIILKKNKTKVYKSKIQVQKQQKKKSIKIFLKKKNQLFYIEQKIKFYLFLKLTKQLNFIIKNPVIFSFNIKKNNKKINIVYSSILSYITFLNHLNFNKFNYILTAKNLFYYFKILLKN